MKRVGKKHIGGCPREKIEDVFVMRLWILTVFELWKYLKLNETIIYTVFIYHIYHIYHLRISVEDLIKFFTFTVREISRNVGFLWSVFSRVWTESYDSVHMWENTDQRKPAFQDTSRNVKYSNQIIFSSISLHPLAFSHFDMKEKRAK